MRKESGYIDFIPKGLDMEASCKAVGDAIKESGFSDRSLAERLGVTVQSINRWRHGHAFPDLENLYMMSQIFGNLVDDFLVPIGGRKLYRQAENGVNIFPIEIEIFLNLSFSSTADICRRLSAYYERLCA